jgi:hypothetical protein
MRFKIPSRRLSALCSDFPFLLRNKKIHDKKKLNKIFIPTIIHVGGYGFSFSKVHVEIFISFPSGALGSLKISTVDVRRRSVASRSSVDGEKIKQNYL